ncbi:MAG: hypothetical protein PHR35_11705 [Kiritimatiellae bacterium]|nr:hypothetical protein [Kiritimatiellia bacterium]
MNAMRIQRTMGWIGAATMIAACVAAPAQAAPRYWVGTTGIWHEVANWDGSESLPGASDDVAITNAGANVTLTDSVSVLSLTLSQTLTFTNWTTCLNAANDVLITNGGVMTCAGPFTNAPDMSNRVYIICDNLTIAAGGTIDVKAKGYAQGNPKGNGPGGGTFTVYGPGASHGGYGTRCAYNNSYTVPYDSTNMPSIPGSGGVPGVGLGSHGGGAVWIEASGVVTVNGTINADSGVPGSHASGGSGGAIYVRCDRFAGSNGLLSAIGTTVYAGFGGMGGGGRIAVDYNPASQTAPVPTVGFNVNSYGDPGTLFFPDTSLFSETISSVNGAVHGVTNWATASLIIRNSAIRFEAPNMQLDVSGNVLIDSGKLSLGGDLAGTDWGLYRYSAIPGPALTVGGNLVLTNSGALYVYGAATTDPTNQYGALVDVEGDMILNSGAWVYPRSDITNGGAPIFRMSNLSVATNAGFNANGAGCWRESGLGAGCHANWQTYYSGGGSHGGMGIPGCPLGATPQPRNVYGALYGSSNAPVHAGSGGGGSPWSFGGAGGGVIRIEADATVNLNGTLTANGQDQTLTGSDSEGGGSGGSIYVRCHRFAGTTAGAVLSANGGSGSADDTRSAAGGGGRIAVWRVYDCHAGTAPRANGGTCLAGAAGDGTVVWGWLPPAGTVMLLK